MTGFEPATSCSQTLKCRFFPYFTRLFGAFVSEINAFGCSCQHCFHVVRSRRWSTLWSESKLHIFTHLSRAASSAPRWIFCYHHYTIKSRTFQVPSRCNICDAVIKDNAEQLYPHYTPAQKDIKSFSNLRGLTYSTSFFEMKTIFYTSSMFYV